MTAAENFRWLHCPGDTYTGCNEYFRRKASAPAVSVPTAMVERLSNSGLSEIHGNSALNDRPAALTNPIWPPVV
jgi:hypothetical protein